MPNPRWKRKAFGLERAKCRVQGPRAAENSVFGCFIASRANSKRIDLEQKEANRMEQYDREGQSVTCPSCGATYFYHRNKIAADGTVQCQNCGKWLSVPSKLEQDRGSAVTISAEKEAAARIRKSRPIRDFHIRRDVPTALYHGLYLSFAVVASFWMWIYVNYFGRLFGGMTGTYVGYAIILFGIVEVVGYMNVFLVQNLWEVYCRRDWGAVLCHGGIVSLLLLAAIYPATYIVPILNVQSIDVYVPVVGSMVLLYWVGIGLVGRFVAYLFLADKPEA